MRKLIGGLKNEYEWSNLLHSLLHFYFLDSKTVLFLPRIKKFTIYLIIGNYVEVTDIHIIYNYQYDFLLYLFIKH